MGLFTKIGELADKVFALIAQLTKKLAKFILNNIRKVAMTIGKFFTLLTQWLDKAMDYVAATFNVIVDGVQTFLKKVGNEYQEISYNYTQQQDGSYMKDRPLFLKTRYRLILSSLHSRWKRAIWWICLIIPPKSRNTPATPCKSHKGVVYADYNYTFYCCCIHNHQVLPKPQTFNQICYKSTCWIVYMANFRSRIR